MEFYKKEQKSDVGKTEHGGKNLPMGSLSVGFTFFLSITIFLAITFFLSIEIFLPYLCTFSIFYNEHKE